MHGGGKPTFSLFMDNKTEWLDGLNQPVNPEKKTLQIEKHVQFLLYEVCKKEGSTPSCSTNN